MKHRAPRKKKKKAKKLKAANDAMVMVRTAMITANSYAQLAIVSATPIFNETPSASLSLKALRIVEITMDTAKSVAASINDIKHWIHFVPNYRMR